MTYKELVNLGFERFEMCDGFDRLGFNDFYLFLKINKEISFEWNWDNSSLVKMVRYKGSTVQNYIEIDNLKSLKTLLYLYQKKEGNSGTKPIISDYNKKEKYTVNPYHIA